MKLCFDLETMEWNRQDYRLEDDKGFNGYLSRIELMLMAAQFDGERYNNWLDNSHKRSFNVLSQIGGPRVDCLVSWQEKPFHIMFGLFDFYNKLACLVRHTDPMPIWIKSNLF